MVEIHLHCIDGDWKSESCRLPFQGHREFTSQVDFEIQLLNSQKAHATLFGNVFLMSLIYNIHFKWKSLDISKCRQIWSVRDGEEVEEGQNFQASWSTLTTPTMKNKYVFFSVQPVQNASSFIASNSENALDAVLSLHHYCLYVHEAILLMAWVIKENSWNRWMIC